MSAKLFVLDGPAAVGKSGFSKRLLADPELALVFCPRVTSRKPEAGDTEYSYVTAIEFDQMVKDGEFASYRVFPGGISYGVPRKPIDDILASGQSALAIVDLGTGEQIKETWPDAVTFFLISPSDEIEERLQAMNANKISKKVQSAIHSYSFAPYYDYVLPNRQGRSEQAYSQLRNIIAQHCI